jgi:diadenosine tetraphosphatase ApaH/serine/threonine PP2A family protein phosphatase
VANEHTLDDRKTMVNVGSVGQPRDGDWRACYVLLDGPRVTFRRIEYDVEETIRKIHAVPELDRKLGDRLRRGE